MVTARPMPELARMVRAGDYDRFLAIQLAPAEHRASLYALAAFGLELARTAEAVTDVLIGHIRLAWWREAIQEIEAGNKPRAHPVVEGLAPVLVRCPVVIPLLIEMVEARAADLDPSLVATEDDWRNYGDHTAGNLHMAMALVIDTPGALACEEILRADAMAYAFVGLVRAVPLMAGLGKPRFPLARLAEHQLASLEPSERLNALVRGLVAEAGALWRDEPYPPTLTSLRVLRRLTLYHMRRLGAAGFDPYRLKPGRLGAAWCAVCTAFIS